MILYNDELTKEFEDHLDTSIFARPDFIIMPNGKFSNNGWDVIDDVDRWRNPIEYSFKIWFPSSSPTINDFSPDWTDVFYNVDPIGLFRKIEKEYIERNILSPEKTLGLLKHDYYGWIFPEVLKGRRI